MTTIVLADDHHIVLRGLRALFEPQCDFDIIGETGDGLEAVEMVERLQPDVLVLDLMMPGLHGLEVTRAVRKRSPKTRVVILSMYANEAYVSEALGAGAHAYVIKQSVSDQLLSAVREAIAGRHFLSPPLSDHAIQAYVEKARAAVLDGYETLTARERQVLQLAAEGLTSTQIAGRLCISPRTVERHRANLMKKLDLHSRPEVIRYAMREALCRRRVEGHSTQRGTVTALHSILIPIAILRAALVN